MSNVENCLNTIDHLESFSKEDQIRSFNNSRGNESQSRYLSVRKQLDKEHIGQADLQCQMLRAQFNKYDPVFNFFFSKPVSDLCDGINSPEEMMLKELGYWDNEHQFLKRYYRVDEVPERIQLLVEIHHPPRIWNNEFATLSSFTGRKYVLKYIKRKKKLEKKLQEIAQEEHVSFESSFMSQTGSQQEPEEEQEVERKSYDSSLHDIYEEYEDPPLKDISTILENTKILKLDEEDGWGQVEGPQSLTMDFDDLDQQHILKDYNRLKAKQNVKQSMLRTMASPIVPNLPQPSRPQIRNPQLPHQKFIQSLKEGRPKNRLVKVISHQNFPSFYQRQQSRERIAKKPLYRQEEAYNEIQQKRNLLKLRQMTARQQKEDVLGYLSPRVKELSKYPKRIMLQKRHDHHSIEQQDYLSRDSDSQMQRVVLSPGSRYYRKHSPQKAAYYYVNSLHHPHKPSATLQQDQYRTVYEQPSQSQSNTIPRAHHNNTKQQEPHPKQWIDPLGSRQFKNFDRIRKKAIQLIRQERNYPSPNELHRYRKYQK